MPEQKNMHWHKHKDGSEIYQSYAERKLKMPVSVALGCDPAVTYAATAPLPKMLDEMMLAGWLRKSRVKMVKCITNNIYVPADAEFVLEGYVDPTEDLVLEGPFGDHTGYYSLADYYPRFHENDRHSKSGYDLSKFWHRFRKSNLYSYSFQFKKNRGRSGTFARGRRSRWNLNGVFGKCQQDTLSPYLLQLSHPKDRASADCHGPQVWKTTKSWTLSVRRIPTIPMRLYRSGILPTIQQDETNFRAIIMSLSHKTQIISAAAVTEAMETTRIQYII